MPLISFKNVRFFKGTPPPTAGRPCAARQRGEGERLEALPEGPVPLILLSGIVLTLLLSSGPARPLPALREGQVAPADIVAPADFTIEDRETTEERRREKERRPSCRYMDSIPTCWPPDWTRPAASSPSAARPLKTPARDFAQIQKTAFEQFGVELGPAEFAALDKAAYGADLETALINLLEKYESRGVLFSKSLFNDRETERGFTLVRRGETDKAVGVQDVPDIREVKKRSSPTSTLWSFPRARRAFSSA